MTDRTARLAAAALATAMAVGVALVEAQVGGALGAELDAERAWQEAQEGHHIRARELAEARVRDRPDAYGAHFVLGYVHHYGEANHARALYHLRRARALLEAEHGEEPADEAAQRWHWRILRETVWTLADLERYEDQLRLQVRFSELYQPAFLAERAWPLMKLRRFDDAREAVELALASEDARQEEIAWNARCAIDFEAGHHEAALESCRTAMTLHGGDPAQQSAVDFTNYAEASRASFRFDEAERVGRLATRARASWYGNPWVELAELYVREGRVPEALGALREVPGYRERRPPHVREADRNDSRRALASFFLVLGRAQDALRVSQEALEAPDRQGHNSRDPQQDRAIVALLARAAHRLRAERIGEGALGASLWTRMRAWAGGADQRWGAWTAGRVAARNLADEERLVGTFMIGTHRSAVMPPWLVGDLIEVLGAGVVLQAVHAARAEDERPGSGAYYDAFEAEALWRAGFPSEARVLARTALARLGAEERLLIARTEAVRGAAAWHLDAPLEAGEAYDRAYQLDPCVFRRLDVTLPVRIQVRGGPPADAAASLLGWSPRLATDDEAPLVVAIDANAAGGTACLRRQEGTVLGCGEARVEDLEEGETLAAALAGAFHEEAFAPRVTLSQLDANGLDGSNRVTRDPLRTLFGVGADDGS
ncbi:MAG: hypothetical protein ACFCGT_28615 [Sandaracinaceae bacterium]